MVDVVEAISNSLEMAKRLRDLNKKVGEADFKMLLADLTSELGDARLEAANMKVDLASLKEENIRLKAALAQKGTEPDMSDGLYKFDDSGRLYCTGCYDSKDKKVMVREVAGMEKVFGKWHCPNCSQFYGSAN